MAMMSPGGDVPWRRRPLVVRRPLEVTSPGGGALEPLLSKPRTPPSLWKSCFWLGLSTTWAHDTDIGSSLWPFVLFWSMAAERVEGGLQADPGYSVQLTLSVPTVQTSRALACLSGPRLPARSPEPGAHLSRLWGPWLDSLSWPRSGPFR